MLGGTLSRRRVRARAVALVTAGACGGLLTGFALLREGALADNDPAMPRPDVRVAVLARAAGPRIAPGFIGISFEYPALTQYTGVDPARLNSAFERLVANLAPGQSPVIRIGGNSTDTTWWPTRRLGRPAGASYSLSPRWLAIVTRLADALGARLILGIDLEARPPAIGRAEARAFATYLPRRRILALEIGNEPSRYAHFPWYHTAGGAPVLGRSTRYDFRSFAAEFAHLAHRLPEGLRVAGPTLAGDNWMSRLAWFLRTYRDVGLVTFHRYPMNRCFTLPGSPHYPTIGHLLSASASESLGQLVAPYVAIARRDGLPARLDEINSVACGGKRGVSDTFASALWALDTAFAMARAGLQGINFHTFPRASYALFHFRRIAGSWSATVAPEYYGLLAFTLAAPPGSRLIATRKSAPASIRCWATRGPDGTIRVTLINDDLAHRHVVLVRLPRPATSASVTRLVAPGARATRGVRLGGASFDSSGSISPRSLPALVRSPRVYLVPLPAASAAILTARVPPAR